MVYKGTRGVQEAELDGNVDSENNHGRSSIGLDVHKKTIATVPRMRAVRITGKAKLGRPAGNWTAG